MQLHSPFTKDVILDKDSFKLVWSFNKVISVSYTNHTHVTGSGHIHIFEGSGSGKSKIRSRTQEWTDLWYLTADGKERDVRLPGRLSIREGHVIVFTWLEGEQVLIKSGQVSNTDNPGGLFISLFNHSTNQFVWNNPEEEYTEMDRDLAWIPGTFVICVSLFAIIIYGLGVITTAYLIYQSFRGMHIIVDHQLAQKKRIEDELKKLVPEWNKQRDLFFK